MFRIIAPYGAGYIEWVLGEPAKGEDLCEVICRNVTQAGIELTSEAVDHIQERLHLPSLEATGQDQEA